MKKNTLKNSKKLKRIRCEISECDVDDIKILHKHHIIERTDLQTSNNDFNLCVLCPNHHSMVHTGTLKIIGVYPSTGEQGRTLIYELNGKPNVPGITEAYFKPVSTAMKLIEKDYDE